MSKVDDALELVRSLMQSMSMLQRQTAILNMVPQVRAKLLAYMERSRQAGSTSCKAGRQSVHDSERSAKAKLKTTVREASTYDISKVYRANASQRLKYQANIHIKALRLYTREQSNLDAAIEHQIVLVQIKQALNARSIDDPEFWDDHRKALQVCEAVLQSNRTSEVELGLRAWVHLRAPRWLGSQCRIGSSVTTLASALQVHGRLLHAKATSWECLRAEWIHLVQVRKQLPLKEAESIVDRSREATLKEQLARALKDVQRILSREGQRKARSSVARGAVPPRRYDIE